MKKVILVVSLLCLSSVLQAGPQDPGAAISGSVKTMSNQTIQMQAHADAVQTFLNVALQYLDGLDRQLKTGAPLSNSAVQEHTDIYTQKAQDALNNARAHLMEYHGVVVRAPATEKSAHDDMENARKDLAKSIELSENLSHRIQIQHAKLSLDTYRKQVAELQSQIKTTLSDAKSLRTES